MRRHGVRGAFVDDNDDDDDDDGYSDMHDFAEFSFSRTIPFDATEASFASD